MFYGQDVHDTRALFFTSWAKYLAKKPLSPLEQQLVRVISDHPEYHALFHQTEMHHDKAYFPELGETNPFLHLGLHLAIREQTETDRPEGIASIFKQLVKKLQDPLAAEHAMMERASVTKTAKDLKYPLPTGLTSKYLFVYQSPLFGFSIWNW